MAINHYGCFASQLVAFSHSATPRVAAYSIVTQNRVRVAGSLERPCQSYSTLNHLLLSIATRRCLAPQLVLSSHDATPHVAGLELLGAHGPANDEPTMPCRQPSPGEQVKLQKTVKSHHQANRFTL